GGFAGPFRAGVARRNSSRRVHPPALELGPAPAPPPAAWIARTADGKQHQESRTAFSSGIGAGCPSCLVFFGRAGKRIAFFFFLYRSQYKVNYLACGAAPVNPGRIRL